MVRDVMLSRSALCLSPHTHLPLYIIDCKFLPAYLQKYVKSLIYIYIYVICIAILNEYIVVLCGK